jgi:hypothetical protein
MKAGLCKVVFDVRVRILVIVACRRGPEKRSGEHATVTKAKVKSFIQCVFSDDVEFVADVPARAGTRVNGNCAGPVIEIVIRCGQPEPFELLFESPFLSGYFFNAGSVLHKIPAADQIGEAVFVVIRRIDLVKGIPVTSRRILGSRGVVELQESSRRCGRLAKGFAEAGIPCPRADGIFAE